jgi:hypothetical protein
MAQPGNNVSKNETNRTVAIVQSQNFQFLPPRFSYKQSHRKLLHQKKEHEQLFLQIHKLHFLENII